MRIDPLRYPLLHSVFQGARWIGQDDYPSTPEWANEHERWLQFLQAKNALSQYLPRIRDQAPKRDETLAEIGVAYFLETQCGLPIVNWEPLGANGKRGEFLAAINPSTPFFVEVKSPGWKAEIVKAEGQNTPRLRQPKYIDLEARSTAPWESVRVAVDKAYPKIPDSIPTLLIINDDRIVSLNDSLVDVDIALYCPRANGYTTGYLARDGCFVDRRYERLGGVGILNVESRSEVIQYRFALFRNPNALPKVKLPLHLFSGYPCYDGSG